MWEKNKHKIKNYNALGRAKQCFIAKVLLDIPLEECVRRDIIRSEEKQTESLYRKAQEGVIENMIGINGPKYEFYDGVDGKPDLIVRSDEMVNGAEETAQNILDHFVKFLKT